MKPITMILLSLNGALLVGLLIVLQACNGPKVTVYISDPKRIGMEYYNQNTKQSGFVSYSQTDKFVCLTPTDAETVLDYVKTKEKGN